MHFLDRFLALLLGEFLEPPVVKKPKMQPILVDGAELKFQRLVQSGDNFWVALHAPLSKPNAAVSGLNQKHSKLEKDAIGTKKIADHGAHRSLWKFAGFFDLGDGAPPGALAVGVGVVNAALAAFAAFFEPYELGAGFCEGVGRNPRVFGKTLHCGVNRRNGDGRARAAVHLFLEVPENDAGRRQEPWSGTHDFGDRKLNIPIGYDGARADDHNGSNRTGFKAPASDARMGNYKIVARKGTLSSSYLFTASRW
jgi:hypothetical protein